MGSSSNKNKLNKARKFTLEALPVYYIPAQQPPRQSRLQAVFLAHKFLFSTLILLMCAAVFFAWQKTGYSGLQTVLDWKHEIAASGLLILTACLWSMFYKHHQVRKIKTLKREQKMELTAIKSKVMVMPAQAQTEMPLYVASESLSIDYWVSRETMNINDEDLALGNLPDEYIAPDALVLSCEAIPTKQHN